MELGYIFGAVDVSTRSFGKIIDGKGKRFKVLWSTGTVSETEIPEVKKVILNSPSFFALIQPERNLELFESDPLRVVGEILWEAKCLAEEASRHPGHKPGKRPGTLTSAALKKIVLDSGVSEKDWAKAWAVVRQSLSNGSSLIEADNQDYWLKSGDIAISSPIEVDWKNLENALAFPADGDSKLVSPDKPTSSKKTAKSPSSLDKKSLQAVPLTASGPWSEFLESITKKNESEFSLGSDFSSVLGTLSEFQAKASKLDGPSLGELQRRLATSKAADVFLVGAFLARTPFEPNRKIGQLCIAAIAEYVQGAARHGDALTVIQRVALAQLLCLDSTAAFVGKIAASSLTSVAALTLSLTSPELANAKDRVLLEVIDQLKHGVELPAKDIENLLVQFDWESSHRRALVEAMLEQAHELTRAATFWEGISATDLVWLSRLTDWPKIIGRSAVRGALNKALNATLQGLNPKASLQALTHIGLLGQVLEQSSIDALVNRALDSNAYTKASLEAIMATSLVSKLEAKLKEVEFLAIETKRQLQNSKDVQEEQEAKIAFLTAKLDAAGNQVKEVRDNQRLQYQLDAAKALARILSTLDNELGAHYNGRDLALSQSKKLGVFEVLSAGSTTIHTSELCDDPESNAKPGDEVRVLASGFGWNDGTQEVVLVRALVTAN